MSIPAQTQQAMKLNAVDDAGDSRQTVTDRRRSRARAVGVTAIGALLAWLVAEVVFGTDLRAPAFGASQDTSDIGAPQVLMASLLGAAAGWGFLAILERFTSRARTVWVVVATVMLVLSLGSPMSGTGITGANRALLVLLHLVVGAIVIPSMYRTSASPSLIRDHSKRRTQ